MLPFRTEMLGVEVSWQSADWKNLMQRLDRRPSPLFYAGWRADYPDPDNLLRVGSHSRWAGWQDETYLGLVEQARRATDPAQRIRLYQQADRILVEAAAIVPVMYGRQHFLVKPWVRRFSTSAIAWALWKNVVIEEHG